ncbi:MAG: TonB-dependent receptor, partial [Paraperlucidibaca sp.]
MRHFQKLLCLAPLSLFPLSLSTAWAGGIQTLDTVTVESNSHDLIGVANSASEGTILSEQLELRPLLRPAEVLEVIPGLIVSQHSGSGKANQYYLRGFNLDHGTDFAASLIGMPLNMPTHGHGQGYLDLQFLIPELVDRVQYRKGALAADVGDFATAGSVAIDYKRKIDAPFLELGVGEDGYRRGLAIGSSRVGEGDLLHAFEWTETNGPWVLDEDLIKRNAVLRYSQGTRDNGFSISGLAYSSSWQSTDQIPRRAIASGQIDRFGNVDDTVGGRTHRYSLSAEWAERTANQQRRASVYAVDYKLNLFSNFTYFLNDPVNGDQFEQLDDRRTYGGAASNTWFGELGGLPSEFTVGTQIRHDAIDAVGLFTSTARQRTGTIRLDKVDETSVALYAEHQLQWHPKFRTVVGLRADAYRFDVKSDRDINSGRTNDQIASPKL